MGQELIELPQTMDAYHETIYQYKQTAYRYSQEIYQQTVLNLLGHVDESYRLTGTIFNQEKSLSQLQAANERSALFIWHLNQTILYYLFGQDEKAVQISIQTAQYLDGAVAMFMVPLYSFFDALIQLTQYPAASSEKRQAILLQVQQHQDKLQHWAALAPSNHQHRWELVAAEKYRVLGNKIDAIEAYDRAIASAKENNFIQDQALANELAAKFYLNWGKEKFAANYIEQAYYCYAKWGAKAKIADLENLYPNLLHPILQLAPQSLRVSETLATIHATGMKTSSNSSINATLDFAFLLEASQAIFRTIELDELIQIVTHTVLESGGADKCVLLLSEDNQWQVRAIANLQETILESTPLENHFNVPIRLIQYVQNTLETVVIDNLKTDLPSVIDDYLHQYQPQSILCFPILNHENLVGILYLENQLIGGTFTSDRLNVLNFLSTQAAISLENARLYQHQQKKSFELEKFQSKLKFLIQSTPIGVIEWNSDFNVVDWNSAAEKIFGYTSQEMLGNHALEIVPKLYQKYVVEVMQALLSQKGGLYSLNENIAKDGRIIICEWINTPLLDEEGNSIGIYSMVQDITARKNSETAIQEKSRELQKTLDELQQAQVQMIQSEKMSALGNLVAGIAHEINNPVGFLSGNIQPALNYINDIFGLLDLYQQKYPNPAPEIQAEMENIDLDYIREDLPKLVGSMSEGVKRIKDISNSLRTFSRADSDRPIPFKLHEGINSTILILKHRLKANESRPAIEVITNYGNIPEINCFPGQLNQVFMNILANAVDALEESNIGRSFAEVKANPNYINIQTSIENEMVKIVITDNGKGMSEPVKQKIFDHLFTTKAVGKGTGLGLAIARQIVEITHGGKLECTSVIGQGTEFVITLPVKIVTGVLDS